MEDFVSAVSGILVPKILGDNGDIMSPEMIEARKNIDAILDSFLSDHTNIKAPMEDKGGEESAAGPHGQPASARIHVQGMAGSASFSFQDGRPSGSSSGGAANASADASTAPKRQRLGMSEADLSSACTVMDMPAARARVTPQFLVDKPLDVRMCTPLLVHLYASVRKVTEGIALLTKEVVMFEGDDIGK